MSSPIVRRGTIAECIPLRAKVLRAGMPIETASFPGDDEPETFHVVAEKGGPIVGCATYLVRPFPLDPDSHRSWQLRGMAVDPALQGTGLGTAILAHGIEILDVELHPAGSRPGAVLWCKARLGAISFYRNNGWVTLGDEFEIPPFGPHVIMRWGPF